MDLLYSRQMRIISTIVLFFFGWSFGGGFDIAAFAATGSQKFQSNNQQLKTTRPEKKFESVVNDLFETLVDPAKDANTKKNKAKTTKAVIEALDVEIKKQFVDTEKTLKDKGLPPEILEKHRKFVLHYEDNLAKLKTNLNNIEKAKTKAETDAEIDKAKAHLEKVRPPKRKPLDPNKLPHRMPEEKQVIFEEYKPPEKRQIRPDLQKLLHSRNGAPLQVVANGSLKGLLTGTSKYSHDAFDYDNRGQAPLAGIQNPAFGYDKPNNSSSALPAGSYQIALATPPTAEDLAENGVEIRFTPAIRAKAAELGGNPTKIYNWIRNNIEYTPTNGSIQGGDMCLQTKQCNDTDTASLLISLYRVSGIYAHYRTVTAQIPIEKVKNFAGGFTDSMAALNLLASAGIPVKGLTEGGQIKYVQMQRTVVEAFIDHIPSRGEIHRQGDTWILLDPSFKQYRYTPGIDIKTAVPFDAQSFIDQIKATATINETAGYVTNVNSALVQQTMSDYQTRVQNYISQNYPNATVGDILGKKEIIQQNFPYLLGTLPYKPIITGASYSSVSNNLRHKITFNVTKDMYDSELGTPINITKSLPELAGKKITLSYSPATPQDEAVINSYLPKPHADGSPIQPNELPSSLPAYLINLKPELRIDGVVVATGTSVGMGNKETFTMTFSGPGTNANDLITNDVTAGNYLAIALDLGRMSKDQATALKTKFEMTKTKLEAQNFAGLSKEDILGDLLYSTALSYHAEVGLMKQMTARIMGVVAITLPSETIFSFDLKSNFIFGIPISVSSGGLAMDADRLMTLVKAVDGNKDKHIRFMRRVGANESALEHTIPEQLFSTSDDSAQGISAVKALTMANDQGIPIYKINQSNMSTILPQLQVDADVKADIQNAVNSGKEVIVSKTDVSLNGWTGCGYIINDPVTGAGAYMISGGLSGGLLCLAIAAIFVVLAVLTSETVIGAYVFGMLAFFFAFQGISLLYGDEAANEFLGCILGIVSFHYIVEFAEDFILSGLAGSLSKLLGEIYIAYLLSNHAINHFKHCLEELYGHLFVSVKLQKVRRYALGI